MLEDLGSKNGTFVNGRRISGAVTVAAGDRITLGQRVPMPWPDAAPGVQRVIRIGGAQDNDVVLDYPMISAHHARILVGAQGAILDPTLVAGAGIVVRAARP